MPVAVEPSGTSWGLRGQIEGCLDTTGGLQKSEKWILCASLQVYKSI